MNDNQVMNPGIKDSEDRPLSTADLARGVKETPVGSPQATPGDRADPLFVKGEAEDFRSRWQGVQTAFVDEPKRAVQQADELVAAAIKRLAEVFATERDKLEHEWDKNEEVSTEELRLALRRYRSFFDRLLSV